MSGTEKLQGLLTYLQKQRNFNHGWIALHENDGHPNAAARRRELVIEYDGWIDGLSMVLRQARGVIEAARRYNEACGEGFQEQEDAAEEGLHVCIVFLENALHAHDSPSAPAAPVQPAPHGEEKTVPVTSCTGKLAGVDESIVPLVEALNRAGIETVASCSGHGHRPGNIALRDGRELIIARNYEEARAVDRAFPDIHGEWREKEAT